MHLVLPDLHKHENRLCVMAAALTFPAQSILARIKS